jgi:hypothetical protein
MVNIESKTNEVVRKVEAALESMKGVVGVLQLSREDLRRILELEEDAERMMTGSTAMWYNEGVRDALKRQAVLAIVKTFDFPQASAPTVLLVSNGEVVGEEIPNPRKALELMERPEAVFIADNFVLYRNRVKEASGKDSLFLFPAIPFPALERVSEIENMVSASPAVSTDVYIKSKGGWNVADPRLGTVLVGFDING